MSDLVVNVSYCQAHRKRPRDERLDGTLHALWLEQCVDHLLASGVPVAVSVTCWPGEGTINNDEADVLRRVGRKAGFSTMPEASHQKGAAWNIRQGLVYARRRGHKYMIHTAEDVVVTHGALSHVAGLLREGHAYVGSAWDGVVHERPVHGLNSQFFGCDADYLHGRFDPKAMDAGTLEEYLLGAVGNAHSYLFPVEGTPGRETHGPYAHTHDYEEWLTLMRQAGANL